MNSELKIEIDAMVSALKQEGKVYLAKAIEENWDKTCLEYSKSINSYHPDKPIEKIMKKSIEQELHRLGYTTEETSKIVAHLEVKRILNTYPHITCSGKPRHLFIDWLSSLSLKSEDYYIVAMFSGVPFSNKTRPGRICGKDYEANLMPSNIQDEMVYRSDVPEKMLEVLENLPINIKEYFPKAKRGESYTKWAIESSLNLEKDVLKSKSVFIDFNEVISNYLLLAIQDTEHPISKILFSPKERSAVIKDLGEVVFFYGSSKKNNISEMENYYLRDGYLESESEIKIELNKETLAGELENRLCPGMVLSFFIFAFLNRFQCFGSFAQIEYLPFYHDKFATFDFLKEHGIDKAPAGALTTGGFKNDIDLHVLDLALEDEELAREKLAKYENTLFGEAILTIKDVLLHQNYSMNLVRK